LYFCINVFEKRIKYLFQTSYFHLRANVYKNFVVIFKFFKKTKFFMNIETAFLSFGISSLVIGITILAIYSSFGPGSENLIDPFEEDDD